MTETYREALIAQKVAPATAQMIEDVCNHAIKEAVATMIATVQRLPDEDMRSIGMIVAYAMLNGHVERVRDGWNAVFEEVTQ